MGESESDSAASFFDVDALFSYNYGQSSELGASYCQPPYTDGTVYSNTNNYEDISHTTVHSNTNNDDISHTLQEGLSRLSITGASEWHTGEYPQSFANVQPWPHIEYSQSSFGVQPWHIPPENYYAGNSGVLEDIGCCSSTGDRNYDEEEQNHGIEITNQPEIDGEIDRQQNEINAVPHTPQTNRDIRPVDDAMPDHETLLNRLRLSGFVEREVEGDGNCQFRALSDQFYQTPEHHRDIRKRVVNQGWGVGRSCDIAGCCRLVWCEDYHRNIIQGLLVHRDHSKDGEVKKKGVPEFLGRSALQLHCSSRR